LFGGIIFAGEVENLDVLGADITGHRYVGGLVENNLGSVITCYSAGGIVCDDDCVFGLLLCCGGFNGSGYSHKIIGCFWDEDTSGLHKSVGGTGLSTPRMQQIVTYLNAGWDIVDARESGSDEHIWWILEGQDYPRLWWELISEN